MADRDKDLTQLFVRDLDDIPLPARDRWRPAPRKEPALMKTSRYVLSAAAVAAVLAIALIASFTLRDNHVATSPTSATATTTSVTSSPTAVSASPAPTGSSTGVITGTLSYPSHFVPPLTVYAVSVADQRVFFSVDKIFAAEAPPPAPDAALTYTISGVAPGTYVVFAYRNDMPDDQGGPALYSNFVVTCTQPSSAGRPIGPGACENTPAAHSLVPVTVRPGETVSGIDPQDWTLPDQVQQGNLPPRPR